MLGDENHHETSRLNDHCSGDSEVRSTAWDSSSRKASPAGWLRSMYHCCAASASANASEENRMFFLSNQASVESFTHLVPG